MIESLLYVAIGFLAATLLMIAVIPLIHERAVRLTVRRVENGLPLSMAEIRAAKDALRADFALSTRRLEIANERLRGHVAHLMVRIAQRDDQLRQLRSRFAAHETFTNARSLLTGSGKQDHKNHRDAA